MPNIHLPTAVVSFLRPSKNAASAKKLVAEFPRHFNKIDVMNYVKSVYQVTPLKVSTVVLARLRKPHPRPYLFHQHPNTIVYQWNTMRKRAFITLDTDFQFPPPPPDVQVRQEKKDKRKQEIEDKRRETRSLWDDKWDQIVRERYQDVKPLEQEPCEPLTEQMSHLKLDEAAVVKRSVERRLKPETVKIDKKWLVPRKVKQLRLEASEKRKLERAALVAVLDDVVPISVASDKTTKDNVSKSQ